ncbi:MAG: hypothetical protein ACREAG_06960 [Nitrosopumilaceae archaeon]
MQKNQNAKLLIALGMLFVLAMSSLAVASAQTSNTASTNANVSDNEERKDKVSDKAKDRVEKIRTEIVDKEERQLEEKRDTDRHDERNLRPTIAFDGKTEGWAVIGGTAYESTISLHDGKAAKVGEHLWRVTANGTISVGDRIFDVDLKGKVQGTKRHDSAIIQLHGKVMFEGEEHRVALSGYLAPTNVENTYALAFTKVGFKGEDYHFLQVGHLTVTPLATADISLRQSQDEMASFRATVSVE